MRKITEHELKKILHRHKGFCLKKKWGIKADLRDTNLSCADLRSANLRGANLEEDNLEEANLLYANLIGANLRRTDLLGSDLTDANLEGADLDFSALPMWCGSTNMKIDSRLSRQFVYHGICNMPEGDRKEFLADPIGYANKFHRVYSGDVKPLNWG